MSQMSFRDDDVKNLKSFMEFIRDKASFELSLDEAVLLTKYITFMQSHIKQVNAHVMELIRVTNPPSESSSSAAE